MSGQALHSRFVSPNQENMNVQARIDALGKEFQALSEDVVKDEHARQKLLGVTQQAAAVLETGPETIWRLLLQVNPLSDIGDNIGYETLMISLTISLI